MSGNVIGAIALIILLIIVLIGYSHFYNACKSDADCTTPNTCQSSKCAPAAASGTTPGGGPAVPPGGGPAVPPGGNPEVYVFNKGRNYSFETSGAGLAAANALNLNAKLATNAQVTTSYNDGADWCFAGWDVEGEGVYPIQVRRTGCADVAGVATSSNDPPYGVSLYGVKPSASAYPDCFTLSDSDTDTPCIIPFNGSWWSYPHPSSTAQVR